MRRHGSATTMHGGSILERSQPSRYSWHELGVNGRFAADAAPDPCAGRLNYAKRVTAETDRRAVARTAARKSASSHALLVVRSTGGLSSSGRSAQTCSCASDARWLLMHDGLASSGLECGGRVDLGDQVLDGKSDAPPRVIKAGLTALAAGRGSSRSPGLAL